MGTIWRHERSLQVVHVLLTSRGLYRVDANSSARRLQLRFFRFPAVALAEAAREIREVERRTGWTAVVDPHHHHQALELPAVQCLPPGTRKVASPSMRPAQREIGAERRRAGMPGRHRAVRARERLAARAGGAWMSSPRPRGAARVRMAGADGMARWTEALVGAPTGSIASRVPDADAEWRNRMLARLEAARQAPPPEPVEVWAISERYRGIEHARVAVVDISDESEREPAEHLVSELMRLRQDQALLEDILSRGRDRRSITAVVANLANPKDPGRRKAVDRIRRSMRPRSQ